MIRKAKKKDLQEILSLEKEILENTSLEKLSHELEDDNYLIYVYEDGGLKGYMTLLVTDVLELHHIVVSKKYQNRGIGAGLLAEAFQLKKPIFLEVSEINRSARRFYEKNGFRCIGVRKKYYGDQDGLVYEWRG